MQGLCILFLDYFKFLVIYTGYNPTQKNCIKKTPNSLRVFSLYNGVFIPLLSSQKYHRPFCIGF